jgi:hypothetical protein
LSPYQWRRGTSNGESSAIVVVCTNETSTSRCTRTSACVASRLPLTAHGTRVRRNSIGSQRASNQGASCSAARRFK